jgi:flagellar hook protein FlgE
MATLISISATPTLRADTVWTNWASATVGAPGMATGSLNGVTVSYKGEVIGAVTNGSSADCPIRPVPLLVEPLPRHRV